MALKWKIGDVVQLPSGGPAMTLSLIEKDTCVECAWFVNGELRSAKFHPDALVKAKHPQYAIPGLGQGIPSP